MLDTERIIALSHRCAACDHLLRDGDVVVSGYFQKDIRITHTHIELGIIGADVRTLWFHLDCHKKRKDEWRMYPELQICIRCGKNLEAKDIVQPAFQVTNPRAINPSDPTDVGIALNERIYLVHYDCRNTSLDKNASNILLKP